MAIRYDYGVCQCGCAYAYQVDEDGNPTGEIRTVCYECDPPKVDVPYVEGRRRLIRLQGPRPDADLARMLAAADGDGDGGERDDTHADRQTSTIR